MLFFVNTYEIHKLIVGLQDMSAINNYCVGMWDILQKFAGFSTSY